MANYIDGFLLPIARQHLDTYREVAEQVGEIWKEYGATAYFEFVGDDLSFEGMRSFADVVDLKPDEVVVFGWAIFPSKKAREAANTQVPLDPRMGKLVGPLTDPNRMIFDARRMVYGGFKALVGSNLD